HQAESRFWRFGVDARAVLRNKSIHDLLLSLALREKAVNLLERGKRPGLAGPGKFAPRMRTAASGHAACAAHASELRPNLLCAVGNALGANRCEPQGQGGESEENPSGDTEANFSHGPLAERRA